MVYIIVANIFYLSDTFWYLIYVDHWVVRRSLCFPTSRKTWSVLLPRPDRRNCTHGTNCCIWDSDRCECREERKAPVKDGQERGIAKPRTRIGKEEIILLTQSIMQTSAGIAANAMIGEETISRMKKSLWFKLHTTHGLKVNLYGIELSERGNE